MTGQEMLLNSLFKILGVSPAEVKQQIQDFIVGFQQMVEDQADNKRRLQRIEQKLDAALGNKIAGMVPVIIDGEKTDG